MMTVKMVKIIINGDDRKDNDDDDIYIMMQCVCVCNEKSSLPPGSLL